MENKLELLQYIDHNKIFIINHSDIEGRLDPAMALYNRKVRSFKFNTLPLKALLLKQPQYGANESGIARLDDKSIRYIRITDIDEYGLLKVDSLGATAANIDEKYIINDGDILFARSGATVGKAYLHNTKSMLSDCIFAGYMIRFVVDRSKILSEYLFTYTQLKPYKDWINAIQRAAGQPNINAEEYKSLLIPLPPIIEQRTIVSKIQQAYHQKKQKEAEAKALLDSIDYYLLVELGINLPQKDNRLENRIFYANLRSLSGKRFDTKPYDNNTVALKLSITKFDNKQNLAIKLSNIVLQSLAGDWGVEDTDDENYIKCLVVRATEFDNSYNINLDNSRVKYRYIYVRKYEKMDIAENDLLIEKSGGSPDQPVGRISILTKDILMNRAVAYSNFIHKIRVDSNIVDPMYLFCFLRTMYNIGVTEYMQSQTNGIRNLIMSEYLQQDIIIPVRENGKVNIDKQIKIANHISEIRAKAKALQQEAQDILDNAKKEVEQMILGE